MIEFATARVIALSMGVLFAIVPMLTGCGETKTTEPAEPSLPRIEYAIDATIRPSRLESSTGVLQLTNLTKRKLDVSLYLENKDSRQWRYHEVSIDSYRTEEIGMLEAEWKFEPNETVKISCEGYASITYKTYRTEEGRVGIKKSLW